MSEKVMLIVGSGPGISLKTARRFGNAGFKIALIARRLRGLEQFEEDLKKEGIEAKGFTGDASSETSLKAAIGSVIKTFGRIDVLLYNAASGKPGKPTELSANDLINDFKTSVAGALTSVKEVIPHMKNGAILLTGGGLALYPYGDFASLSIGKAGLRSLASCMHQELNSKGIYVGLLTIRGFVQEDTYFSSENIAETFYEMYKRQDKMECIFDGE